MKSGAGLICSCCGVHTRGRQFHNRDTGYGLCPACAKWIGQRESVEYMEMTYGKAGVHYDLAECVIQDINTDEYLCDGEKWLGSLSAALRFTVDDAINMANTITERPVIAIQNDGKPDEREVAANSRVQQYRENADTEFFRP